MRDADSLILLAKQCEQMGPGQGFDRAELFGIFRAAWPRAAFASGQACDEARNEFFRLWESGAQIDAAMLIAPPGCIYRSGHSAIAPTPRRFFCDAVTDGPHARDCHALADAEPLARLAAFLRAHIPMEERG